MSPSRRLLTVVLLIALAVRLWGIGFGLPAAMARPDETQIAGPAVGYLSGSLNPPFFQWPTLFSYSVALVYTVYVFVGRPFGGYATLDAFAESRRQSLVPFLLIPRLLTVVLGVLAVWWLYRLGRRAFDSTVGLVAALFLALALLHVRDSHFGVTDAPMTALVVLAVLAILRWRDEGTPVRAVWAGLATGLAATTKYNGGIVVAAFAAAWMQRAIEGRFARRHFVQTALVSLLAYTAATAVAFFAGSPYILMQWQRFRADTGAVQATLAAGHGLVLTQGWWYYPASVLPAAVGWPILLAGVAGIALLLTTRFRESVAVLAFPLAYYAVAGRGYAVFARYILPVVPFVCLAAAWFVVWVARRVASGWSPRNRGALIALAACAVVAPTARDSVLLDRLLARTDNRVVVARELLRIIPAGDSFYQSGESYGQVPLGMEGRALQVERASFDSGAGRFTPADPDWVLLQRSPLRLYSGVPVSLEQIVADRYELVRGFPTGDREGTRFYDQQDAFFLPLTGLDGLQRPGPAFELYRRREK